MSSKKQFGVWMDAHRATIVKKEGEAPALFSIIAHVIGKGGEGNSNEHSGNNHEKTMSQKFFKEVAAHMPNVDELHITGTGQAQEQFAHFLSATPQYKNTKTFDSTANKMTDEALLEFFAEKMK